LDDQDPPQLGLVAFYAKTVRFGIIGGMPPIGPHNVRRQYGCRDDSGGLVQDRYRPVELLRRNRRDQCRSKALLLWRHHERAPKLAPFECHFTVWRDVPAYMKPPLRH